MLRTIDFPGLARGRAAARSAALFAAFALVAACGDDDSLPEAQSWQAPSPLPGQAGQGGAQHPHAGMQNPHAGMTGNPHAGMGENPHAGMTGNPHAGMDPAMAAFDPPDPQRPIDPNRYLRGAIRPTDETAQRIERGDIMFLSAKPIDPASGEVIGAPVAVDRLIVSEFPLSFELSEEHMMVAGTAFEGHVVVEARVDSDGEAMTRLPGDVEGAVRAEIPAEGLELSLDTIIE